MAGQVAHAPRQGIGLALGRGAVLVAVGERVLFIVLVIIVHAEEGAQREAHGDGLRELGPVDPGREGEPRRDEEVHVPR